jgi:hypothetical protein
MFIFIFIFPGSVRFNDRATNVRQKERLPLPKKKKEPPNLVSLVLLNLLPKARVRLDANLLGGVELVEAAQVHVLGEQRDHVLVEGLPVRVLEVVPDGRRVRFCGVFALGGPPVFPLLLV